MNHIKKNTHPEFVEGRITGKFLALSLLLISASAMAMDTELMEQMREHQQKQANVKKELLDRVKLKKEEKLSNKEENIPLWNEVIKEKFNNLIAKTGIVKRWGSYKQKVNDNDYVKITKVTLKKVITFAKEHEIPTSIALSIAGYMTGNLMPVKLVDGVGSSCVTLNVPFVGSYGLCIPVLASFVYNNVKFFNGVAWGAGTYYKLKCDKRRAKIQRRMQNSIARSSSEDDLLQQEKEKFE